MKNETDFELDLLKLENLETLFYTNLDFCKNNIPENFNKQFLSNIEILENNISLFIKTLSPYDKKFSKNEDYKQKITVFNKMDKDFWNFKFSLDKNLFH